MTAHATNELDGQRLRTSSALVTWPRQGISAATGLDPSVRPFERISRTVRVRARDGLPLRAARHVVLGPPACRIVATLVEFDPFGGVAPVESAPAGGPRVRPVVVF
ncbi:MAG TPA: hypothetical protein VG674_18860 [Amycolatopsis sp.]|nr:hypothetical protein [Amycolatopsis sp.]